MIDIAILNKLNAPTREERRRNLEAALETAVFPAPVPQYINNHIHTTFSFSPYSPTAAVYAARAEGLCTAGIVDHDSIAGAEEFLLAGEMANIPVTVGMECRASMAGTAMAGRRTNNPDQDGVSYVTLQSVPHGKIGNLNEYFAPYRAKRLERIRKMTDNCNALLAPYGVRLDFDKDVLALSEYKNGGGLTERHLMLGLARAMIASHGKGAPLVAFLGKLGLALSEKQTAQLMDTGYPFYDYDLLGVLKGAFVPQVFIPATDECPNIREVAKLADEIGCFACYAYLGDVGESVTGDKKAQAFEDAYLEEVFDCLRDCGIRAVTYMPTRNTRAQLIRLRTLCGQYGMLQVSGEDINSPRQSFVIRAMEDPMFENLIEATWMLIRHENEFKYNK